MKERIAFIDWRPDLEDFGRDGLVVAENVVHEPEGFKPLHLATTTSFATTGGLAASNATVLSIVAQPIGPQDDLLCAWLANVNGEPTLYVGVNGVTAATTATGHPLSFRTGTTQPEIQCFDVTEIDGKIVFTVLAQAGEPIGNSAGSLATNTVGYTARMDF